MNIGITGLSDLRTQQGLPRPAWLWFIFLGGLLYFGRQQLFPPPLPVLGPPDPAHLAALSASFAQLAGRAPTAGEQAGFVEQALREELLFREAIERQLHLSDPAVQQRLVRNMRFLEPNTRDSNQRLVERALELNMHLTDEVVRRRLVQGLSMLLIAAAEVSPPAESELRAAFEARRTTLIQPARISFVHRLLGDISEDEAIQILTDLRVRGATPQSTQALGEPFVFGHDIKSESWVEVSARFGPAFTRRLRALISESPDTTGWLGPVASTFGQHLLFIEGFQPARGQRFEEAADTLRADLIAEKEAAALDRAVTTFMAGYRVAK